MRLAGVCADHCAVTLEWSGASPRSSSLWRASVCSTDCSTGDLQKPRAPRRVIGCGALTCLNQRALGGTRTLNLLIRSPRRYVHGCPPTSVGAGHSLGTVHRRPRTSTPVAVQLQYTTARIMLTQREMGNFPASMALDDDRWRTGWQSSRRCISLILGIAGPCITSPKQTPQALARVT